MLRVRDTTSTLRTIADVKFFDGAVLREIATIRLRTSEGLKTVFSRISASLSPSAVHGLGNAASPVTTNPATCNPVGGAAPYTYTWSQVSGDPIWTVASPGAKSTAFTASPLSPGEFAEATFQCVVTDSSGATATTAAITASAQAIQPPYEIGL